MPIETKTLSQVVGKNARNLRGRHTLEDVAEVARSLGARWSSGSVSTIELGRSKCTIETLAILALALDGLEPEGKTVGGTVTIHDLLQTENRISLTSSLYASSDSISSFLSGKPSGSALDLGNMVRDALSNMGAQVSELNSMNLPSDSMELFNRVEASGRKTLTEERLADKIGIHVHELRSWAVFLWGKSFEDHRDEIAGEGATPQKKGRVSRELLNEIQTAMSDKATSHGDD